MSELFLLLIGTLLVNNFVLAQFLGLCPFMGVTRGYDTAVATSLATTFVLALAAMLAHVIYHAVLVPLDLAYLRIVMFITVIAGVVQLIEVYLKAASPLLHRNLGIYLPLITSNCAVLAVALLAVDQSLGPLETFVFAVGAALGFALVMILFGAMRERIDGDHVPTPFRGAPIALVSAGLMSLAFMGFVGFPT